LYKKITIYLVIILFYGCSVFKSQNNIINVGKNYINIKDIQGSNLTNFSFYIQRVEIELNNEEESKSFLASVKFSKPDSFLISIRSKSGIEAARIFVTGDTLMINDRINKILYYGSGDDLNRKFGYSGNLIPLLFGDFLFKTENDNYILNCKEGIGKLDYYFEDNNLTSSIDCSSGKLVQTEIKNKNVKNTVLIKYLEVEKERTISRYSKVQVFNLGGNGMILIKYSKIEIPYRGYIEFIPGKNYELVRIR
jgi:hypothetical protein